VLEANAKVNGRGQISHPHPTKTLNQFGWQFKYIITSAQGVDVQNLAQIDSAVMNLRMRGKTRFRVDFFCNISIYLSIYLYLPFFVGATGHIFGTILTLNGLNDVFSQPLVPLGVSMIHFNI